jgi:hypothetical protein
MSRQRRKEDKEENGERAEDRDLVIPHPGDDPGKKSAVR